MKTFNRYKNYFYSEWSGVPTKFLVSFICIVIFCFSGCQKFSEEQTSLENMKKESLILSSEDLTNDSFQIISNIYFGPKTFKRSYGQPITETARLENLDFQCYDGNFMLKIQNGQDKYTRVPSAEIRIDGMLIVSPSDFSKNVTFITKPISGLSDESVLEVKLNGTPGSFIDLWIEGTMTMILPGFTRIGPLTQGSIPPVLPDTSLNGIAGSWSPDTINTAEVDTIKFVFTPSTGQCAIPATMYIQIIRPDEDTISDRDGNRYPTIRIGNQLWMAENLKTTRYNNGDLIGTTTPARLNISGEAMPKYQWAYNGNEDFVSTYGRLYTWHAVTDSRGICPEGWHVSTDADWAQLTSYLIDHGYGYGGSGDDIAQALASESGTWKYGSTPGSPGNRRTLNNRSGFSAIPSGMRTITGNFLGLGLYTYWWTSTETNSVTWIRSLENNNIGLIRTTLDRKSGASVRCVRNN